MTGDELGRLAYLALLLAAVGGYAVAAARRDLGQSLRLGALWTLIFLGAIAVAGLWGDIRSTIAPTQATTGPGRIEVPLGPDGHFHLRAEVNGTPIRFVVDTGATSMVLSRADAAKVGLNPDQLAYFGQARTANGTVRTAPVTLDRVVIGPFDDRGVRAVVNDGEMRGSLLGMSYLSSFASVTFRGQTLVLER
ncbi:TIGR02281 family clan AA aspartic protease [Paracoccus sp. p3-h83]|uniref:retropepsin-like aspartic protease family protein n=1 Tax=Paracoccus sp. p3-h83 TaxID=3342805 RepID=UPI0035B8906F